MHLVAGQDDHFPYVKLLIMVLKQHLYSNMEAQLEVS